MLFFLIVNILVRIYWFFLLRSECFLRHKDRPYPHSFQTFIRLSVPHIATLLPKCDTYLQPLPFLSHHTPNKRPKIKGGSTSSNVLPPSKAFVKIMFLFLNSPDQLLQRDTNPIEQLIHQLGLLLDRNIDPDLFTCSCKPSSLGVC